MPVYEYRCKKCGKVFDYKQKMADEPLKECLENICEEPERGEVERVISGSIGFQFKGTGFYSTDYGKNKSIATSAPACKTGDCACNKSA
jgi:putative FmdB family regulatory protein